MSRNIVAVVVGLIFAIISITVFTLLSHMVFPFSAEFTEKIATGDPEVLKATLKNGSLAAFLGELAARAMGCFVGGLVCGQISNKSRMLYGLLLAVLLMLMGVQSLRQIPRPLWYQLALLFMYIPPAWVASKIMDERHKRVNEAILNTNQELRAAAKRKSAKKK